MDAPASPTHLSIRRSLLGGAAVTAFLVFGLGGWAATAEFSGAVIAPGSLVVESSVKKVQHPTGGVVGELRVRDGDHVKAGDIVMRLDETVTRANYAMISKSLDELAVRRVRLSTEQDDSPQLRYPPELQARAGELSGLMGEEKKLFDLRASARRGQKEQLRERIEQLREQTQGMADQIKAKQREIDLIAQELQGVRDLFKKNLIPITRVTALERDAARLEGERGALVSSIAQVKGRISETELQILQIDQDMRAEVGRELSDIRSKISELGEKRIAAEDQLKRVDIRAPQDGVVHQLAVHTVGGVINPSEPAMLIVPNQDALRVEVRIAPQDIDHVRVGQRARLRFSAFNQRTTPEIEGDVTTVSADVTTDQKTGLAYYTVRINLPPEELAHMKGLRLTAGMPVESFIQTQQRTVLTFLTKPLMDQITRTFREQ
ncbi:MAG: type secretion rane fusion protein HlyD family [Hyphomicrobiales bacterium]|nr:type secretion rane fusion protein HlyD family [Hyphomicrobiales bacterium]